MPKCFKMKAPLYLHLNTNMCNSWYRKFVRLDIFVGRAGHVGCDFGCE